MKVINFIGKTGNDGQLHLSVPVEATNATVEVTVVLNVLPSSKPGRYDFADLAGRMRWKGDALMEQRKSRDEW